MQPKVMEWPLEWKTDTFFGLKLSYLVLFASEQLSICKPRISRFRKLFMWQSYWYPIRNQLKLMPSTILSMSKSSVSVKVLYQSIAFHVKENFLKDLMMEQPDSKGQISTRVSRNFRTSYWRNWEKIRSGRYRSHQQPRVISNWQCQWQLNIHAWQPGNLLKGHWFWSGKTQSAGANAS